MTITNPNLSFPFELHTHGVGGFVVFDAGEQIALPLMTLSKATLRGTEAQELVLEYAETIVVVEGNSLAALFDHLLSARLKRIRVGHCAECTVERILITDNKL